MTHKQIGNKPWNPPAPAEARTRFRACFDPNTEGAGLDFGPPPLGSCFSLEHSQPRSGMSPLTFLSGRSYSQRGGRSPTAIYLGPEWQCEACGQGEEVAGLWRVGGGGATLIITVGESEALTWQIHWLWKESSLVLGLYPWSPSVSLVTCEMGGIFSTLSRKKPRLREADFFHRHLCT